MPCNRHSRPELFTYSTAIGHEKGYTKRIPGETTQLVSCHHRRTEPATTSPLHTAGLYQRTIPPPVPAHQPPTGSRYLATHPMAPTHTAKYQYRTVPLR